MYTAIIVALLAVTLAQEGAPSVQLECDIVQKAISSLDGKQPLTRRVFYTLKITVDKAANTALFERTSPSGMPSVAVRELAAVAGDKVFVCQADVCQKSVPIDGWNTYTQLTIIDLKELTLNRVEESSSPSSGASRASSITEVRDGQCRKI